MPSATPAAAPATERHGSLWLWLLAGASLLVLGAGAAWFARVRPQRAGPVTVPHIERPRVATPSPPLAPRSPPPAPLAPADPLELALEPLRLSLTLVNAALTYRLEVANHGHLPLANLVVEADMISAHASLPREQQLAGPEGAARRHVIEALAAGESRIVEGEFRLPFPQIVPIRQGNVTLLLPLARFRAQADGTAPVVRTFAVGQPGTSGLQPFRLDQGPRIYPQLVQRAFA